MEEGDGVVEGKAKDNEREQPKKNTHIIYRFCYISPFTVFYYDYTHTYYLPIYLSKPLISHLFDSIYTYLHLLHLLLHPPSPSPSPRLLPHLHRSSIHPQERIQHLHRHRRLVKRHHVSTLIHTQKSETTIGTDHTRGFAVFCFPDLACVCVCVYVCV